MNEYVIEIDGSAGMGQFREKVKADGFNANDQLIVFWTHEPDMVVFALPAARLIAIKVRPAEGAIDG